MKKNPKDGGRYQRAVKASKKVARKLSRTIESHFRLPRGCVRICLTSMTERQRVAFTARFD